MDNINSPGLIHITGVSAHGGLASQEKDKNYYDYQYAKGVYDKLISGWSATVAETERQRDIRYVKDSDSADLRTAGLIAIDAIYTPARLVDTNIRTEQPSYIRYITQSRRSIIFASSDGIQVDGLEKLEDDFTKRARYDKWEIPFIRMIDGGQAHGWDALELLFDEKKPGNFCFEHIGHDRLIFSVDCEDIEAQEVIAIKKMLTSKQLKTMVAEGFNEAQVNKLIETNTRRVGLSDCVNECYEVFFKEGGIVHMAWYATNCDDYLKSPAPLFMGMRDFAAGLQPPEVDPLTGQVISPANYPPIFETEFPVILYRYIESNDPRIVEIVGRVRLDEAAQEGASALQSSFVNGCLRASKVYGSPAGANINDDPNGLPILTDVVLSGDRLISRPINWWNLPYPQESVIKGMQTLILQNKQEQSRPDFAATNRKDSGKTATEMNLVAEQKNELSSVQVILLSITLREAYAKAWKIYQNRVLQGRIIIKDPTLLNLFGKDIAVDEEMRVIKCSGPAYYIIKSSGDVDVVQRNEKLQRLMQGWEVFGKTPLAMEYLKDIIRYAFPEDAARYISVLEQAEINQVNQLKALLQQTAAVLQASVVDPASGELTPAAAPHKDKLIMLAQHIQQALASPDAMGQGGAQEAAA